MMTIKSSVADTRRQLIGFSEIIKHLQNYTVYKGPSKNIVVLKLAYDFCWLNT